MPSARLTRGDFQKLSTLRVREACLLLRAGLYDGAYYLSGLSVECGLKACIAKATRRHDFPDKQVVIDSWTHDLAKLLKTAGLGEARVRAGKADGAFERNWVIAKDWAVDARYGHSVTKETARDMYAAVTARGSGVLRWLKQRW
jgi:HEPN domain-containing protein